MYWYISNIYYTLIVSCKNSFVYFSGGNRFFQKRVQNVWAHTALSSRSTRQHDQRPFPRSLKQTIVCAPVARAPHHHAQQRHRLFWLQHLKQFPIFQSVPYTPQACRAKRPTGAWVEVLAVSVHENVIILTLPNKIRWREINERPCAIQSTQH